MKRRVLVLMLGMTMFLCAALGGCLGSSKPESLDKYWNAIFYGESKDDTGKKVDPNVKISGLTKEGKEQTFLILPKKMTEYEDTRLEGSLKYTLSESIDFGKVRGVVFERDIVIYRNAFNSKLFGWIYCSSGILITTYMLGENYFDSRFSGNKYPIIYPDSFDIHKKVKEETSSKYDGINFKSLSENIKEYKTEDGELWSKFTNETNLVFDNDVKLYKDELIIIASEEMESITFPKDLKKLNKLRVIPSEKQPEGIKITVNISSTTTIDKDAFDGNENIKIVRY